MSKNNNKQNKNTPKTKVTPKPRKQNLEKPRSISERERPRTRNQRRREEVSSDGSKRGGGLSISKIRQAVRKEHAEADVHAGCDVHKAGLISIPGLKYLSTVGDPGLDDSEIWPIPADDQVPGPVGMRRYVSRGTFTCSSTSPSGFAFISVSPGCCGGYNDRPIASFTNSTYTGSSFDFTSPATQYNHIFLNSPYNSSLNPAQYSFRVTSCKLEIRNATPEMGRGGTLYAIEPQAHDPESMWAQGPASLSNNGRVSVYNLGTSETMSLTSHPSTDAGHSGNDGGTDDVDASKEWLTFVSFTSPTAGTAQACHGEGICMVQSPPSVLVPAVIQAQQLDYVITVIYECTGTEVHGKKDYVRDAAAWGYASSAINEMKGKSGAIDPPSRSPVAVVKEYVNLAVEAAEEALPIAQNLYSLLG